MIDKVSSEFVDNTWLGPVIDIYQTSVALISRRNTSSSEQESKSIQGSPVFNADDEHIATLGLSPSPCVQLKNTAISRTRQVLFMTFSWLALNKFCTMKMFTFTYQGQVLDGTTSEHVKQRLGSSI